MAQPVIVVRWLVGDQAFAAAVSLGASTASTRIRFLVLVACSNLTLPVRVANTV